MSVVFEVKVGLAEVKVAVLVLVGARLCGWLSWPRQLAWTFIAGVPPHRVERGEVARPLGGEREIDLVIERADGRVLPVEVKLGVID